MQRNLASSCTSRLCCKSLQNLENCFSQVQHTCQTPVQHASFSTCSVYWKHGRGGIRISIVINFSNHTKSFRSSSFQNSPAWGGNMLCIARSNFSSPSKTCSKFLHSSFGWTFVQNPFCIRFHGFVWYVNPNLKNGKSTTLKMYNMTKLLKTWTQNYIMVII